METDEGAVSEQGRARSNEFLDSPRLDLTGPNASDSRIRQKHLTNFVRADRPSFPIIESGVEACNEIVYFGLVIHAKLVARQISARGCARALWVRHWAGLQYSTHRRYWTP